ncbi:MAG: hypothetical protein ACLR3S_02985 [Clostridium fessum]
MGNTASGGVGDLPGTGGPMPYLPMIEEDLRHAEAVWGSRFV